MGHIRSRGIAVLTAATVLFLCSLSFAYQVPYDNSNVKYFYVFGKNGDPLMGKEDSKLELVIDVPENEPNDVVISVYDPDTGGKVDWMKPGNEWDTRCEFALYGKKLLAKQEFGAEPEYNQNYYQFGPYSKTEGEKIGGFYRFRLVVSGLSGDDENLFKVKISPDSAEAFSENITFRLLPRQGDKMYFYPQVPGPVQRIAVHNYDLDINGGFSTLSVTEISKKFSINDSESGEWRKTDVPISTDTMGRLVYVITKKTQRYANAGLKITDSKGNILPIYFRKGSPPVAEAKPQPVPKRAPRPELKCNKFTFDATSSYDIDKQELSFLWNFGDGQTSAEPVVTHIYDKGGEYNVTLTVKDSSGLPCDTDAVTQKVYVNTPPVAAFDAPQKTCVDSSVRFDAGNTRDDTPDTLTYMWNFGDGSRGEGKTATHTYDKGGMYDVTLMVDDNAGTACSVDSIQKSLRVNSAPVADAGKDVDMCLRSLDEDYTVYFDGSGSRDRDGDSLTYMWDFGDGSTDRGEKVTHVYEKSGDYRAKLTVDDGSGLPCSASSDTADISLNKAPVAVAGDDIKACTGDKINFNGGSSRTESGESLSYLWDFGDGETATGQKVSHKYSSGGKYTVMLTVDDGKGTACSTSVDMLYVDVNARPSVSLKNVEDVCIGTKVHFNASASDPDGDSLDYSWNFGDGSKETGSSRASHIYEKGGIYTVRVAVDDGRDSPCSGSSDAVKVRVNTPPIAGMTIVKACCVDMEQKFFADKSNDPDGDKLSYSWDFGDGNTATGANVSHAYSVPGTYKVVLVVDDGSGTECSTGLESEYLEVNAKPVAIIKVR